MKPSLFKILAMLIFSFELGTSTVSKLAIMPFLIRVSISAMGSLILMRKTPSIPEALLPAGFNDARDLPAKSHAPKANPADTELSQVGPGSAADRAPIVFSTRKLLLPLSLDDKRRLRQFVLLLPHLLHGTDDQCFVPARQASFPLEILASERHSQHFE